MNYIKDDSSINLLNDFNLDEIKINNKLKENNGFFLGYDIFLQDLYNERYILEDGIIKDAVCINDCGFGVRIFNENNTSFVSSTGLSEDIILKKIDTCKYIYKKFTQKKNDFIKTNRAKRKKHIYIQKDTSKTIYRKIVTETLQNIDSYIREKNSNVIQVLAVISCQISKVHIISELDSIGEIRPLVGIIIKVISEKNGSRGVGFYSISKRILLEDLINKWQFIADEALRQSIINISAKDIKPGKYTVVLSQGMPAVLFHEAVGHGLEADIIAKQPSRFHDKLGHQVSSDIVSLVDNGSIADSHGGLSFDDEGTKTQNTLLIEKGKIVNFMSDKKNAYLLNKKYNTNNFTSTGNCKRENYSFAPMPRMTSTYLLPGKSNPTQMISNIKYGIYAVSFIGGQVDIISGDFVFSSSEAYIIRDGKISEPIKNVSLIGNGADALKNITEIGDDLMLSNGMCGKDGQKVPVNVGQPTVRIENITVGGTKR